MTDPLTSTGFSILRCDRCHSGQTYPLPPELGPFYGPAYHGQRHGATADFCASRRLRILRHLFPGQASGRLLDVGCGDGTFLLAAQRDSWQVTGTELNPSLARSHGLEVHESLQQLPTEPSFDCITFWHVLEHLRDPAASLREAASRLKPSGCLVVAVPDYGGWQARCFGRHWLHLDVPRHITHLTSAGLNQLFQASGLVPSQHWHQEFEYDLLGWAQSALNALMSPPNIFFHWLAGKPTAANRALVAANVLAGSALSLAAVSLVWAGSFAKKGGTLIVAARPAR